MIQLQRVANKQSEVIDIEMDDLKEFFDTVADIGFIDRVEKNTTRYIKLFSEVIDNAMPEPSV